MSVNETSFAYGDHENIGSACMRGKIDGGSVARGHRCHVFHEKERDGSTHNLAVTDDDGVLTFDHDSGVEDALQDGFSGARDECCASREERAEILGVNTLDVFLRCNSAANGSSVDAGWKRHLQDDSCNVLAVI
jgi:hypothetical protein